MEDVVKDLCDFSPAKRAKIDRISSRDFTEMTYVLSSNEQSVSSTEKQDGEAIAICATTERALRQTNVASIGSCLSNSLFVNHQRCNSSEENKCLDENTDQSAFTEQLNNLFSTGDLTNCLENGQDDSLDDDEVASTVSNLSGLSDLSNVSGLEWKPITGAFAWAQKQMELGTNPRNLLQDLVPMDASIPTDLDDITLWKIICDILTEPPRRKKLSNVNTLDDVIDLLKTKEKIIVLTGAGVSVSSGIPDFRSRDGIYARLAKDFPDLPDPQAMFDIHYFRKDPRPFYKFAKEIYPGQFEPSLSHRFIKLLEKHGKLLRNYSQNIDTLEQIAEIERVIQCHGSFATATCTKCGFKVDSHAIKDDIFKQNIPKCPRCELNEDSNGELSVMKPDIVFFGEGLPDEFHSTMARDKDECDLLIVVGSSLKVRPVALIPFSVPVDVPQILINREPLKHVTFDVELLGDCDVIINEICLRLGSGWNEISRNDKLNRMSPIPVETLKTPTVPSLDNLDSHTCEERDNSSAKIPVGFYIFCPPNCYLFNGAEVTADQRVNEKQSLLPASTSDCASSRTSSISAEFDPTDDRVGSASGEDSGVGDLRDCCRFDDDHRLHS